VKFVEFPRSKTAGTLLVAIVVVVAVVVAVAVVVVAVVITTIANKEFLNSVYAYLTVF
jgi:hypothetical protein